MDPAIAPLLLVAFGAALWSTWTELRSSLQPATCSECPHCRTLLDARRREAEEEARRQAELRTWYARRHGLEDDNPDRSRD
ncbi:MAG TPA: hypothetical protein VH723_04540 [Candidatus Limnocylindrales bacterium]|jgi:hypothetical protein